MSRRRSLLGRCALGLGVVVALLLVLLSGLIVWTVNTESGTSWLAGMLSRTLQGRLSFEQVQGALAGPLRILGLRYFDAHSGLRVELAQASVDLELLALMGKVVHLRDAELHGLQVMLGPPQPRPPAQSEPFSLEPPIDLIVERFVLQDARLLRADAAPIEVERAALAASWTDRGFTVQRLELRFPQGDVWLAGRLSHGERYAGEGRGRFRWRIGGLDYAGRVRVGTEGAHTQLALHLDAPFDARLDASLEQVQAMPWRFALEVPRFDPRKALMPDRSWRLLAASLQGKGSRLGEQLSGSIAGSIELDELELRIDPLRFVRTAERIELQPLTIRTGQQGVLQASGELRTDRQPMHAQLDAQWQEVRIPERLAGQELSTHGQLHFTGSAEQFASSARLAIGPPRKLVDISFDLQGTPAAIEIERLALQQKAGELSATGKLDLEPVRAWRLQAQAHDFDPGAIVAGWPGRLSFAFSSRGRLHEDGPAGDLQLQQLRGRLRGRELAGSADLAFTARPTLTGTLELRSGDSRIEVRGASAPGGADARADEKPGRGGRADRLERANDELHASAHIDVRNLSQWLPDAEGSLQARIAAQGRWPALSIQARSSGRDLRLADLRAKTLEAELDLLNPREPSGAARVQLAGVAAGGFEFASVLAQASGKQAAHAFELSASGERLNGELRVEGSLQHGEPRARKEAAGGADRPLQWSGLIRQLSLAAPNVPSLRLQSPARVAWSARAAMLEQACLVGEELRICAALEHRAGGALEASYMLAGVHLSLANAFVPDLPLDLDGVVHGEGRVRRLADGEWHGQASLELPRGRIAPAESPEQSLLEYSNLRLAATLAGRQARSSIDVRLGESGYLDGELSLSGLGQLDTRLRASLSAAIPDLSPLALFVPQLAQARGRLDVRASASGTLQEPHIEGELLASELAAQVPELGLELTDGRVRAAPLADDSIALEGQVHSGKGTLSFDGSLRRDGRVDVRVQGSDFLAADIPAAHVLTTPDLRFTRDAQRMALTGELHVPSAVVDLNKLPAGGSQQSSPDVVVIDAKQQEDEEALPLYADVTVVLGKDVKLAGFGLQSTLRGRLAVKEAPGEPATGSGDISVAGTYRAYGQDLTIERGQLLFAGTPLDNPGLSIVATRKVEEVTAGLRIGGTARSPQLSVFSEPAMGQAEALAYLVAGRPLDSVGNGPGEGDALQSAARSLGAAGGGLLAKSIGGRLGIDEAGIEKNEMIGGAAFTVGQYLSPRLYLSYGVGLFEPGEVVSLRYRLSDELSLQTARGSKETRAGIEYRIEK